MGFSEASPTGSTSSPARLQAELDCCMRQDGGPSTHTCHSSSWPLQPGAVLPHSHSWASSAPANDIPQQPVFHFQGCFPTELLGTKSLQDRSSTTGPPSLLPSHPSPGAYHGPPTSPHVAWEQPLRGAATLLYATSLRPCPGHKMTCLGCTWHVSWSALLCPMTHCHHRSSVVCRCAGPKHQGGHSFWKECVRKKLVTLAQCWEKWSLGGHWQSRGWRLLEKCWGNGSGAGGSPSPCLCLVRLWAELWGNKGAEGSGESSAGGNDPLKNWVSQMPVANSRWGSGHGKSHLTPTPLNAPWTLYHTRRRGTETAFQKSLEICTLCNYSSIHCEDSWVRVGHKEMLSIES